MKIKKTVFLALLIATTFIVSACGGGGGGTSQNNAGVQSPSITTQPSSSSLAAGGNTTLIVVASGSGLTYQWQADSGSGFANLSDTGVYSGSTTAALTLTGVTISMNGYKYRVVVSGTTAPPATSNSATLTVVQPTKVIVKLATSGTLPAAASIAGIQTTVNYVTNRGLSIVDSDVVVSGVAAGAIILANTGTSGQAVIGNISGAGFPVGEFATMTFSIAPGFFPVSGDFIVAPGATILDSNINTLTGLSVVIKSVTFQ